MWKTNKTAGKTVEEVFGVDEEKLKEELAQGRKASSEVATLRNEMVEKDTEFSTLKQQLAELEGRMNTSRTTTSTNTTEPTSFEDDPERAIQERIQPTQVALLNTQATLIYDQVSRRFSDWNKFATDIDALLKDTPLIGRTNPAVVENAYHIARGKKLDKILHDTVAGKGEFFVEGASNTTGNQDLENKTPKLTAEEKQMAAKYGMTEEEWVKTKEGVTFV